MSASVGWKRTNPQPSEVRAGAPVRGRTWRELAMLMHWARGHGMCLVPAHRPAIEIAAAGSETLRYKVEPSGLAIARLWHVVLRQEEPNSPPTGAHVDITYPDAVTVATIPAVLSGVGVGGAGRYYVEALGAKSAAVQVLDLLIEHVGGTSTVTVECVCCVEIPRAILTRDATDLGVDLETLRPGEPIYDGSYASVKAVADGWVATWPRRHLLEMHTEPLETTSATFVDLFDLPIPVLPPKRGRSDTTATIEWDVYAQASDGTTAGEIRLTTDQGADTLTLSAGTTAWTWLGPATGHTMSCEDVAEADGLPSGAWPDSEVQFAARRTAGAGIVRIKSYGVWVPE